MRLADVAGALLLVVALAVRARGPRRRSDEGLGTDVLFHLSYIDAIRSSGHRVPRRHDRITGPGHNSYPALMHWLVSFLPPAVLPWVDRYSGLVLDLVPALAASALLHASVGGMSTGAALSLAGLYLLAPGLTFIDVGPRAYTLTPRALSQALWAVAVVLLLSTTPPVPLGVAAGVVVLTALMLLTAKFALQNLVFVAPVVSLLVRSPVPIVLAGCALVLAQVISLGFFARQVAGQLGHLEWYHRRHAPFLFKNASWRPVYDALRRRDVRALGEAVLLRNPLLSGAIRHAHLPVALAWYLQHADGGLFSWSGAQSPSQALAAALCVAALVPWALTSFGPFRILGEPERYLEFAFPASWYLLWSIPGAGTRTAMIGVGIVWFLAVQAANVVLLRQFASERGGTSLREIVEKVATADAPVVLSLDTTECYAFLAPSHVRVCTYNGQQSLRGDVAGFLDWFLWRYPFVHPEHLDEIVGRHDVTHVVVRKASVARAAEEGVPRYDLAAFDTILDTEAHTLLARRGVR